MRISQKIVIERSAVERHAIESKMSPDKSRIFVVIQHPFKGGIGSSIFGYEVKRDRDVISSGQIHQLKPERGIRHNIDVRGCNVPILITKSQVRFTNSIISPCLKLCFSRGD